jgi:hypothetical protein
VFGRVRRGKRSTPDKWYWSEQPTHPAIIDRDTWGKAQKAGEDHRSSRDRAIHNPVNWRAYPFRSRVRCKTVQPQHPAHVAAAPGTPVPSPSAKTSSKAKRYCVSRTAPWPPAGKNGSGN